MHSRLLRPTVVALGFLLALAQAILAALLIQRAEDTALSAACTTVERTAEVAQGIINRTLLQIDGTLAGLPVTLAPLADRQPLDPAAVNHLLREFQAQSFTYRDLLLVQQDGTVWASALAASRRMALPVELPSLQAQAAAGTLAILGPVANPTTGEWSLFLARPLVLPGAPPLYALAEMPVPLLASLLAPAGNLPGLRILLERTAGEVLATVPPNAEQPGRLLPRPVPADQVDRSAFGMVGRGNPVQMITAARSTLYSDVLVVASHAEAAVLADWYRYRRWVLAISIATAALLISLGLALGAALRSREQAEAERAKARATLESAIESMADGFVMCDADDRLVIANSRYRDIYARSAPFIVPGAKLEDIIREGAKSGQYPEAGDDIEGFVARVCAWHRGNHPPMERQLPDGRWILVSEQATPDGGTVGIRTDITALKTAMAELATARDAAAAQTAAKSRFLARMSHELRTPLNGVLGHAQALARDPALTPRQRQRATTLETAGRHLLAVANDVLDLSRVEAGKVELRPAATALAGLLEDCAALARGQAEEKNIAVSLQAATDLPAWVLVDRTRLTQLVVNLLSNAVKFTPNGGRVELRAQGCAAPDGLRGVRIEVLDNGPGIPPEARQAVFGDYVRLDGSASGAGLGLAIAAGLAEAMGGRIGCEDNPEPPQGRGAMFWVELPLPPTAPVAQEAEPDFSATRPLHVLVVDDVRSNLAVAQALLEGAGHLVETAQGGAEALTKVQDAAARAAPYDVVLMDVMMPEMDGLEATQRLRALPGPAARVPVLALTASAYADDIKACLAAGMDGHLSKPVTQERLASALADLPARGAARPTPAPSPALA